MPVLTNVVEIIARGTLVETSYTKNILNVFHYRFATGTQDTIINVLQAFQSNVYSFFLTTIATTDYTQVQLDGRLLDDALQQYQSLTIGTPGTQALPRLTGDVAAVTPFRGSDRGKNFRGGKHWTPIPSVMVTKDELNSVGLTAFSTLQAHLAAGFITSGGGAMQPVIVSKTLSQLRENPTTIQGSDIKTVLLNKTIGTMRGRREKTVR